MMENDLNPYPIGTITREVIAAKILEIIQKDIDSPLRETHGKNRSPRIDHFNKTVGVPMGSPYCASGAWNVADEACKSLGLVNPIPKTASSQAFRNDNFIPVKYLRMTGPALKADFAVFQVPKDPIHGHIAVVNEDQEISDVFSTSEYNTDAVKGDRDGDGAYNMTRSTIDYSMLNNGKLFICFADIPQWIFEHNLKNNPLL